ncbi:helix-turn-helix domain-containing protein [Streptomyces sp. H27-D2]|uniref:helix-turn-helix domain-containing protein n=1 Tax=Streptomyces sp. H27-D2 TaxID=3046304 RepID=UPI002DBA5FA8|nr:GAF domain-containing protein [Streptomyces sp. H27-D2]MEC4019638.1 GAF domain-containing protein [Streptomyces sp. H27-D2]
MPRGGGESEALAVLELLAGEAPPGQFEELVERARRDGATGPELDRLERAKQLGLSIHSQSMRRHQREAGLAALVDTARDLSGPHDLDALLRIITRRARLLLGLDMSYIGFPDEEPGYVHVRASDGHTSTLNIGLRHPSDTGMGGDVLDSPAPFWTSDYLADERFRHSPLIDDVVRAEGLRTIMVVPLSRGTRPFGTLYVADRNVRHFTADEIALMSSLGDLAGVAIEKVQLLDDVTSQVTAIEQHAARTEDDLRDVLELRGIHTRLVGMALDGSGLQALAEEASAHLGGPLRVDAPNGSTLATAGGIPVEPEALAKGRRDAHAARGPVPLGGGLWAAPISAGTEGLGTLFLHAGRAFGDRDEQLLRLAAQAMAILLLLENNRTAITEGQVRDELLDDLLFRPQRPLQQLEKRARRLGLELYKPHLVVIARPEGAVQGKPGLWAASYTNRMGGLKSRHDGCVVLLLPGTDAGAAARAVSAELSPLLGCPVTVSAAGPVNDPGSVYDGYQEAQRCLDAMTALGATGRSASARELGFLGVLLSDNHDVEGFIAGAIGPVVDYDRQRCTELTRTLETYFEAGGSPTHAAKRLHVHPNTVARRLERIGELLGTGWHNPERSLEIQLALRLSRILDGLRGRQAAPEGEEPAGDQAE